MSAVIAFQERLVKTKQEIAKVTADLEAAKNGKTEALVAGQDSKAIDLNHQLKIFQDRLEDLAITKAALEGKLRFYKQNEPEAAKIREQAAASWSQLVDVVAGMASGVQQARKAITEGFSKSAQVEAELNSLAAKHLQLTGEPLRLPDWTLWARDHSHALEVLMANNNSLEIPLSPWTYVSETERREAKARAEAKAKKAQEARVKIAIEQAPICEECKKPMTLRRYVGNDGEVPMLGSGTWEYEHCFQMATKKIPETVLNSK